jgi:excisionase family DNA binding protein
MNMTDQAISIKRLASNLGVCERTARRLIEAGVLKAHKIGRQWRVFESDLREYLTRNANRQAA